MLEFNHPGGDTQLPFIVPWRFHFPEGADNSGFIGWLATHLKERFGTGVFEEDIEWQIMWN